MRFFWRKCVPVCRPEPSMQPLEPRIMLDGVVDWVDAAGLADHFAWDGHEPGLSEAVHMPHTPAEHFSTHMPGDHPSAQGDLNVIAISHAALSVPGVVDALHKDAFIVEYDDRRDDIQSITQKLHDLVDAQGRTIGTLAVLQHGRVGTITFGNDTIQLGNVADKVGELQTLGGLFSPGAQIQFYACSMAGDAHGQALLDVVSAITGADVFASVNDTGSGHGKDWALEFSTNPYATQKSLIDPDAMAAAPLELAAGDVVITTGVLGPLVESTAPQTVNLSEAFVLSNKESGQVMEAWVVANPSSVDGWTALSWDGTLATAMGVTVNYDPTIQTLRIAGGTAGETSAVLATLQGTLSSNFHGTAQVFLFAQDGDGDSAQGMVDIVVQPQPPVNPVIQASDTTAEPNATSVIHGVSISDADAKPSSKLTVALRVDHGSLTARVPSSTNPTAEPTTYTGAVIAFTETLTSINTALAGLQYTPTEKYDGSDTLSIAAVDQTQPTPGSATKTISITVHNDPPNITPPSSTEMVAGTSNLVSGISIADPDIGTTAMTVGLSVSHGTLAVPSSTTVSGNNASVLSITDTLSNINQMLSQLRYTPATGYSGQDTLHITADDLSTPTPGTADANVTLDVTPATNIPPDIHVPSAQSLPANTTALISGLYVSDADATTMTVGLSVLHGTLAVPTSSTVIGNGSGLISITDTLANVNLLLSQLRYTPTTGYSGSDTLHITADDHATPTPGTDAKDVRLLVGLSAEAAVTAPDVQTVNEDATLKINPAISVSYPDANKELKVTLEASHGTLLAGWKGYLSSYTGEGTGILMMTGTQSAINYGLNGARYVPTHDYFGADQLTITYDPQDGSTPLQKTTTLHVNSVNDPPALTVPSTTYSAVSGSPTAIAGITASDPDIGSGAMAVDMRVLHGTVATSSYAASPHIVFSDTLGNVQAQLASLVYTSASSYVGPDFLTITVSDNGNSGAGGVLTDTRTYSINVS